MVQIIDHVEVRKRTRQKQAIEVNFTHEIYDTFNRMPWLGEISMTVKAALGAMLAGDDQYLTEACEEEKNLYVWKRHAAPASRLGVERLYEYCGRLHPRRPYIERFGSLLAVDCGDLMRLVGAWVEKRPEGNWDILRAVVKKRQERVREDVLGGPWDQGTQGIRQRENIADFHHTKKRRQRIRETNPFGEFSVTFLPNSPVAEIVQAPLDFRKALLLLGQDKHAHHKNGVAGRELKRIPRTSNDSVLKIDRLFGLRDICSISGTTADVMYILNRFGTRDANHYRDLGDIYRVLPFGTIAGFHHHSVLEVALPQSLKGYIDYKVGQLTTLLPETADHSSPLTRSVWNTAWKYEKELYDKGLHMICFYHERFPEGAIVFNGRSEWEMFFNSPVSSARHLSDVAPRLPLGHMNLEETMNAIRSIDHAFWIWLIGKLRADCPVELDNAWTTGKVRQ
jgi:hypothetical protein